MHRAYFLIILVASNSLAIKNMNYYESDSDNDDESEYLSMVQVNTNS